MNKQHVAMMWIGTVISPTVWAQQNMHEISPVMEENNSMAHTEMSSTMHANMSMSGMYGAYSMSREASGTSWQPEATPMEGPHVMGDTWTAMAHGSLSAIYDYQGGERGDDKTFSESMFMVMAQRPLAEGTFGVRGMVSLDPLMGKSGYPLLFQTGETADGETLLVDRQHPHDLWMELAATYSQPLSERSSIFTYIGWPGEPALGPTAFMHRFSGMENPEAPLTHHWLDSTHITFGVVTVGAVMNNVKLEGSAFNGREPDQFRYNFETGKLDSYSTRITWNPTSTWSLQASQGHLESPEALEPEMDLIRTTASAMYHWEPLNKPMQTTVAWGQNRKKPGSTTDGILLESAWKITERNTLFGRLERVENDELFSDEDMHEQTIFNVTKLSVGGLHEIAMLKHANIGIGALISRYRFPSALDDDYGENPTSYMVFVRARLQ